MSGQIYQRMQFAVRNRVCQSEIKEILLLLNFTTGWLSKGLVSLNSLILFGQRPGPDWSSKSSSLNFGTATPFGWSRWAAMCFWCSLTTVFRIFCRLFPQLSRGRIVLTAAGGGANRKPEKGLFIIHIDRRSVGSSSGLIVARFSSREINGVQTNY